jgi:hypothetical protein
MNSDTLLILASYICDDKQIKQNLLDRHDYTDEDKTVNDDLIESVLLIVFMCDDAHIIQWLRLLWKEKTIILDQSQRCGSCAGGFYDELFESKREDLKRIVKAHQYHGRCPNCSTPCLSFENCRENETLIKHIKDTGADEDIFCIITVMIDEYFITSEISVRHREIIKHKKMKTSDLYIILGKFISYYVKLAPYLEKSFLNDTFILKVKNVILSIIDRQNFIFSQQNNGFSSKTIFYEM